MMRLIDAENLINLIDGSQRLDTEHDYEEVARYIEECPTVDAMEVKHGEWVCGICTACGKAWDEDMRAHGDDWGYFDPMPPFCNNCGAKMNGGKNDV